MKFFKSATNIILTCIIFVLVGALICSLVVIKKKDNYISSVKAQISENETKIENAEAKISEYEKQIAEKDKTNTEITSQLESAKNEKKKLEDENSALKKKIETLSAQKAAQSATAVSSPQATAPSGNKVCYLTFDDGPSKNTPKILDILKKYNAKATFFVINSADIGYVKRIRDEGHTVGLHTASHNYAQIYSSTDAYFKDLQEISDKVESIIGEKSTVIRFPGGSSNLVSAKYCKGIMTNLTTLVLQKGYSYFDWNVSSGDADSNTPSYTYIRNNVLNYSKNKNSVCVLMHDAAAKTTTVQALPEIIEGLTKMGYRFEAITPETYGYHHKPNN
ncbi:MAG: polysaccharide deacetylase family protein [Acutalibacteraceae bacterium]|nr:polysaccharide deacetylase family protein [Acutalibacteraceae bacterium]